MSKSFTNQTMLILWGGEGTGRAATLALARNGARVVVSDPDGEALRKLAELLKSKDAEGVMLAWKQQSRGAAECARETLRLLDEVRMDTPFLHRIVLAVGLDARFFTPPASSENEEKFPVSCLEAIVETCLGALKKQSRPGALDVLWPAENPPGAAAAAGVSRDSPEAAVVPAGLDCLRRLSVKAASMGVAMSTLRVKTLEQGEGASSASTASASRGRGLRPGEIGEALARFASLPGNLVVSEALLSPRGE